MSNYREESEIFKHPIEKYYFKLYRKSVLEGFNYMNKIEEEKEPEKYKIMDYKQAKKYTEEKVKYKEGERVGILTKIQLTKQKINEEIEEYIMGDICKIYKEEKEGNKITKEYYNGEILNYKVIGEALEELGEKTYLVLEIGIKIERKIYYMMNDKKYEKIELKL